MITVLVLPNLKFRSWTDSKLGLPTNDVNSLPSQDKNSSKNLVKNFVCPKGCYCVHWKSCDWSYKILPFLAVNVLPLRYSKRNEYIEKFMENICDYKARKVCCCDFLKQVPTDQVQNKKTSGKLLFKQNSNRKFPS